MTTFILNDKHQFYRFQEAFRQRSRTKQASVTDHILYNLLRGKDLKRGFTPITNPYKLSNDCAVRPWRTFSAAIHSLRYSITNCEWQKRHFATYGGRVPMCVYYGEIITPDQWQEILNILGEDK